MDPVGYRVIDDKTGIRKNIPVYYPGITVAEFMREVAKYFKIYGKFELYHNNTCLGRKAVLQALRLNTDNDPIHMVRCSSALRSFDLCTYSLKRESSRKRDNGCLPPINNPERDDRETVTFSRSRSSCAKMLNRYSILPEIGRQLSSLVVTPASPIDAFKFNKFIATSRRQSTISNSNDGQTNVDYCYSESDFETKDDYSESDFETEDDDHQEGWEAPNKIFKKTRCLSKPNCTPFLAGGDNVQSCGSKREDSPKFCRTEEMGKSLSPATMKVNVHSSHIEEINSKQSEQCSRVLTVKVQSLCDTYFLEVPHNTTIKGLINTIWDKIPFEKENYTMDANILLLFNHRLHIFVKSNPTELVRDFLQLPPKNMEIDFYVYALPLEYGDYMYEVDTDYNSLFKDSYLWNPVYFTDYKGSERSQSILLSSLYALILYFRTDDQKIAGYRRAMQAHFFIHLRKYFYPPAVLAFKHLLAGSVFGFEKTLLVDALIQLLNCLRPQAVCDIPIKPSELFDFIPLLFCWLLEECEPNEVAEDFYLTVKLVDTHRDESPYFQDPVTTTNTNSRELILEEFDEMQHADRSTRHVDLRSLNRYLASTANHLRDRVSTWTEYEIYNPLTHVPSELNQLGHWNQNEINKLYDTMARKYDSLTIITRGGVTHRIRNQLVLLNKQHTVSLLFSIEKKAYENTNQQSNTNHFFWIFDPIDDSEEKELKVTREALMDEQQLWSDPRLPRYFSKYVITKPNQVSFPEANLTRPAEQVTVVLLDLSRSMFDHKVGSDDGTEQCTHIDICKMMLGTLSDNMMPRDEIHAFGLIEFGESVKVTCPITRDRNQFEKALKSHTRMGQWTHMYDAVNEAISRIKTYVGCPLRAKQDCRKLIICLSDGMNNAGSTTIESLYKKINDYKIVIDFISFLRHNQIDDKNKNKAIQNFHRLCLDSGGYIYSNLHYRSRIDLAGMFEQEAAVWLSKRATESGGFVEKPERQVNRNFQQLAVGQMSCKTNIQNSSRFGRIWKEFTETQTYDSDAILVFVVVNDISFWKVILKGPEETPYENKYWMLFVEFDSCYPAYPPNVRFVTPIYHVNITGDGKICHQIFNQGWAERTRMTTVFNNIIDLLKNPNFTDAVSIEKAQLYRDDPCEYDEQAKVHANKHAASVIESLKRKYQLNDNEEQ